MESNNYDKNGMIRTYHLGFNQYGLFISSSIKEEYFQLNGLKEGICKHYYTNGTIYIYCNYSNGILHGEYKQYYPNEQLLYICNYMNGKLHGDYKEYFSNGNLKFHCIYSNDKIIIDY